MMFDFAAIIKRAFDRTPSVRKQTSDVLEILNEITATSYPDHRWTASSLTSPPAKDLKFIKFTMVARGEVGDLAPGTISELSAAEMAPLFNAMTENGIGRVIGMGMSIASAAGIHSKNKFRPRLDNVDLAELRNQKDLIKSALNIHGVVCRLGRTMAEYTKRI